MLDIFVDERQYLKTVLHKIDISQEDIQAIGSGFVKGKVLNQFSLGEYEDVLRVATTTGESWMTGSIRNHLFCLQENGAGLDIIGKLENLAPGESIYAARFMGSRGYLVTYVKIDPLFTLDLSDPTAPKVMGKLKVPGYSSYIHPLGENHLLAIGKDTVLEDDFAWYQGLKLSIFDVSNFSHPTEAFTEMLGDRGTDSEALYNHKAFTFWSDKNLLAFPVDLCEHESGSHPLPWTLGTHTFSGLYVYRVTTEDGFGQGPLTRLPTSEDPLGWSNDWTRGIFIKDHVYAVQSSAVHAVDHTDPEAEIETILLSD